MSVIIHYLVFPGRANPGRDATIFSITTLSITTLGIMGLVTTLSINGTQHNSIECHYAECRDYLNVMLSVIRLKVVMLSVVRLNVVMLSVVAPR